MSDQSERRNSNRVPYPETCGWSVSGSKSGVEMNTARISDLSVGGVALVVEEPVTPGAQLTLMFGDPGGPGRRVTGVAQHCAAGGDGTYLVGVRFQID